MKAYCILWIGFILICCTPAKKKGSEAPKLISYKDIFRSSHTYDTITSMEQFNDKDTMVFRTKSNSYYMVFKDGEPETDSLAAPEHELMRKSLTVSTTSIPTKNSPCTSEYYDGTDRRKAKLTIPTGTPKIFSNLKELIATLQPDKNFCSSISTAQTSGRTKDELQNVLVTEAWLYTYTREGDEDYHLILGTTNNAATAVFFTAEVAGLPKSTEGSYSKLKNARDQFEGELEINACHASGYSSIHKADPLKVTIGGPIFFDAFHCIHKTGIGPAWGRPKRYWEIHPVTQFYIN